MANRLVTLGNLRKPEEPLRVRICTPYRSTLPNGFVALIEQIMHFGIPGYNAYMLKRETTVVHFGRNSLVDTPGHDKVPFDYLFFIDDDNTLSPGDTFTKRSDPDGIFTEGLPMMVYWMKRILDHHLPICSGVYVGRVQPHLPMVYEDSTDNPGFYENILDLPEDQLIEVAAVGTGFMCIRRDVFETMQARMQQNRDRWELAVQQDPTLAEFAIPDLHPPFWNAWRQRVTDQAWEPVGEDIFFCEQARKLGYKIMVDTGVKVPHKSEMYVTYDHYEAAFKERAIEQKSILREKWTKEAEARKAG